MKATELILNEYYVAIYDSSNRYLFLNVECKRHEGTQPYLRYNDINGYYNYSTGTLDGKHNSAFKDKDYILATAKEIAHLDACIKAGKYVDAPIAAEPEIINTYELW